MSKYNNKQVKTPDGAIHDSRKEAVRWMQLRALEREGKITRLQRQVTFVLLPTQREQTTEVYKRGEKKGQLKEGKVLEHSVSYVADFVYIDADGNKVVEDTKGFRTKDYVIKRKLMLYVHKIRIKEV